MRPPRAAAHALLSFAAGLGLAGPFAATALADEAATPERPTIYRWVDADGIAHYTAHRDRVPSAVRDSITALEPAPQQPANEPSGIAAGAASPVAGSATESAAAAAQAAAGAGTTGGMPTSPDSSWAVQNAGPAPAASTARGPQIASRGASASDTSGLDARIATLEAEIARDEDAIKDFLSAPAEEGAAPLPDTPEFREIARRLPKLQAELRGLMEQRGRSGGATATHGNGAPLGSGSERDDR